MNLYKSAGGGNLWGKWGNVGGWGKANVALEEWDGVRLDKANNVVQLFLWKTGLKGK